MGAPKKNVPPWCSFNAIAQVLEANRNSTLNKADTEELRLRGIGKGYENKVLSALRWLNLIDIDGNVTEKMTSLKVTGEQFNDALQDVVADAYTDLIDKCPPDKSTKENIINYFMMKNDYSESRAAIALSFFVSIYEMAGFTDLSADLKKPRQPDTKSHRTLKQPVAKKVNIQPSQSGNISIFVDGKRHDFSTDDKLDQVVFEALTKELLKKWSENKNEK